MTIKPIPGFTAAMRDACVNIIEVPATAVSENDLDFAYWRRGRNDAAAELRVMPVAPMFPEPMRETPEWGSKFWVADPKERPAYATVHRWDRGDVQAGWLDDGICHAIRDDAMAHGRYLAGLSAKTEDAA